MDDEVLIIRQVSQELGIPSSTIRYYLRHGLVPAVKRNHARYRVFESWQTDWIKTLDELRKCGFGLRDLKKYTNLCRKGNGTIAERRAMIATEKNQLHQKMDDITRSLEFLGRRDEIFDEILQGKIKPESKWL